MNRRLGLAAALLALLAPWPAAAQGRGMVPVQGQLLSRNRGPVPGVTVVLVHSVLGRSTAATTDAYGRFGWNAIPVRPEPYFLEMYWGQKLIFRDQVLVREPVVLQPIVL
ncbi:carboxypeptidase regulatory-like domain-containing protein [Ramlibacter sp. G-1-2-2]|uniref:Carboxypeptidase regulatory-like domain-containing protein n=1 Tax=Ramlibacter agri TaxID=2728837 RepID=A0A848H0P6_9BURK|nr:carboxypeptidase-like regulatory domain-containing protein [Ramlibacter agri]NML42670.1 carboxypeptidase regulatory-like domain-containing protein [Ramlibacter agri]